jgi:23S rRNA (pseudouridine1915-N3)-methyltransferase
VLRVSLVCVGHVKAGVERDLTARYLERARLAGRAVGLSLDLREIDESRARRPEDRKAEEARAILAHLEPRAVVVALDERGAAIDSAAFAGLVAATRDEGAEALAVVIGGPDGLDPAFKKTAAHIIAFGAMTWPHQLVRVMASEQLYRAVTILTGHPYHRV